MTYLSSSYKTFTASAPGHTTEGVLFYRPKNYRANNTQRAVIFYTGAGGNALTTQGVGFRRLMHYLASRGLPVLSIDLGNNGATAAGYAWGNDVAASRTEFVRTTVLPALFLQNDKMALLGGSGGFANALQYARQYPAQVAGVAGHVGLVDLDGFRDANIGGFQAAIDTQYGGNAAFEAAVPTHSPLAFAATIQAASYPVKGWWSPDDAFITTASVDAFETAVPRLQRVDIAPSGHSVPAAYDEATADFLKSVLA